MSGETYSIEVRQTNGQFEAVIAEIGARATGATRQEVLENAQREIIKYQRAKAVRPPDQPGKQSGAVV